MGDCLAGTIELNVTVAMTRTRLYFYNRARIWMSVRVLPVGCAVKCPIGLKMQGVSKSEQIKLSEFSILYAEISRSRSRRYERKLGQND